MFRVGQKVVCVDAEFEAIAANYFSSLPARDEIYTVRAIGKLPSDMQPGIALVEIIGNEQPFSPIGEWGFEATRFRPFVERKTDISIFTEMLRPNSVRELSVSGAPSLQESCLNNSTTMNHSQ